MPGIGAITTDIYVWDVESFKILQSLPTSHPADIVAFKDGQLACLVMLDNNGSTVHCSSETDQRFSLKEVLDTRGGRRVSYLHESRF